MAPAQSCNAPPSKCCPCPPALLPLPIRKRLLIRCVSGLVSLFLCFFFSLFLSSLPILSILFFFFLSVFFFLSLFLSVSFFLSYRKDSLTIVETFERNIHFFRRSVISKASCTYFCVKEGDCEINFKTRKQCQFCRYWENDFDLCPRDTVKSVKDQDNISK